MGKRRSGGGAGAQGGANSGGKAKQQKTDATSSTPEYVGQITSWPLAYHLRLV